MFFVLLILGLIAARIYTGAVGFYFIAGILGGFWLLVALITLFGVRAAFKSFDKHHSKFDQMQEEFDRNWTSRRGQWRG